MKDRYDVDKQIEALYRQKCTVYVGSIDYTITSEVVKVWTES